MAGNKRLTTVGKTIRILERVPHSRFVEMLEYKAALVGIKVLLSEESYTSLASFLDFDEIPTYGQVNAKPKFSGRRVKRGLYKSKNGILINADINGSANVMRKVFPIAFAEGMSRFRSASESTREVTLWSVINDYGFTNYQDS